MWKDLKHFVCLLRQMEERVDNYFRGIYMTMTIRIRANESLNKIKCDVQIMKVKFLLSFK